MRIPLFLLFGSCVSLQKAIATPNLAKRYADFDSVRLLSHLGRPYEESPPQKSLQESTFSAQYDGRFANKELDPQDKHINLAALVQSYLISMNDLGIPTWLMHDTLLSWYLDRRMRIRQSQIDVMVSQKSIQFLAESCNMTVYRHKPVGFKKSRNYLLEVSPHYNESRSDATDARWVDTYTGLYIDLMTLRRNGVAEGAVDGRSTVYALQETTFEGVPARVPAAYTAMLTEEFGSQALSLEND